MYLFPYIKYLTETRNWRGHGIHSPFAFDLAHNIMPEKNPYFAFDRLRKKAGKQTKSEQKRRELLFRLLNNVPAARNLLVVGGSEADAMYLAAVNTQAVCVSALQKALRQFPTLDFVYFDKTTEKEIAECLQHINRETIFAFSDTYTQNAQNWAFISRQPQVRLSIRTFRLGLVYFNTDIQKGNYTLLY
ncbi:MAG: hypothetical protein LBR75_00300 [Prevotellaceae bacterium]|jgi:hypothetical protein|nr:hypothetical protein [Prevotellaceae bacterium]